MYIEHGGKLTCEKIIEGNESVPEGQRIKLDLDFKKMGWTKKNWSVVEGSIPVRPGSSKKWIITGKWTEQMQAYNEETKETLLIWKASPLPENSD